VYGKDVISDRCIPVTEKRLRRFAQAGNFHCRPFAYFVVRMVGPCSSRLGEGRHWALRQFYNESAGFMIIFPASLYGSSGAESIKSRGQTNLAGVIEFTVIIRESAVQIQCVGLLMK
jgi:hypothetical protein